MPGHCQRERRAVRAIAHDLNNLLTTLVNDCADGSVAFQRARLLIGRLLVAPEAPTHVDLAGLLEELHPTLASILPRGACRLRIDAAQDLPGVFARRHELEQVVSNLVVNAAQALGEAGGDVSLSLRHHLRDGREGVVLRVEDTGPGIDPARVSRVFEAGFTTKGSTGLGLALVRETVEDLGGAIEVHPTSAGACFDVFLPTR